MLELKQLKGRSCYFQSMTNIGAYRSDDGIILIDSGNDKEAGRQIFNIFKDLNESISLIVNTHSNADHIGGNAYLQNKCMCLVAATKGEKPFIENTELEPAFLYGGFPFKEIRNKFLMAKPSCVDRTIASDGPILDTELIAVPLPGHFFDMIGIRTPENVFFIADSLFPERIIKKYHVFYIYNVKAFLQTLDFLCQQEAALFVPSHGMPMESIKALIDLNRTKVLEIAGLIVSACENGAVIGDLIRTLCAQYSIILDANQYVLLTNTLKSYLAYLLDTKEIYSEFSSGGMVWRKS